ncbi:MAG: transglycosylase domain-containing protein [Bacteroidia bacterium]
MLSQVVGLMRRYPWPTLLLTLPAMLVQWSIWLYQSVLWGAWGPLPPEAELRQMYNPVASEVYSIDGVLLGKYYLQNRTEVPLTAVSPMLVEALIATEDHRFYRHRGIDYRGLMRALLKGVVLGYRHAGGGSTLSMQLAKNRYPRQHFGSGSLLINKLREMAIARRMEGCLSKDEVLMHYLNTVSFGEQVFGVEAACQRYFGRSTRDIAPQDAALLVGMLQAPTLYNPRLYPEAALRRRNVVIGLLALRGYLPVQTADSLAALPLHLDYRPADHHSGLAPYFRERLRLELDRWLREHPRRDGSHYNLYTSGLRIYTTLHARMQQYAEAALRAHMPALQQRFEQEWRGQDRQRITGKLLDQALTRSPRYQALQQAGYTTAAIDSVLRQPVPMRVFSWSGPRDTLLSPRDSVLYTAFILQCGLLSVEPGSGHVRAWVGGIDHRFFQYDHVNSRRQPGSVFKPLVYAAALEEHMSPCLFLSNEQVTFQQYNNWSPQNADGEFGGEYSMRGALAHSVNVATVNLLMELGPERVVALAHALGVESDLPPVPSLALGSGVVSLREMVQVYAAFANGGSRVEPVYLLRIEDAAGHILLDNTGLAPQDSVLRSETALALTYMLRDVVNEGTANRLRSRYKLHQDIAAKTGTTQAQTDGWFVGYTPDLVTGVWVGAEDQRVHFRSLAAGQGANTALPVWARYMQQVYEDPDFSYLSERLFPPLPEALADSLDCDKYQFPLGIEAFREWWEERYGQEEGGDG